MLLYKYEKIFNVNLKQKGGTMKHREAIHILIMSPIYFRLTLKQRLRLVREYCININSFTAVKK